jgi:hypothetical protein
LDQSQFRYPITQNANGADAVLAMLRELKHSNITKLDNVGNGSTMFTVVSRSEIANCALKGLAVPDIVSEPEAGSSLTALYFWCVAGILGGGLQLPDLPTVRNRSSMVTLSQAKFEAFEKLHVEKRDDGFFGEFGMIAGRIEEYDARGRLKYFLDQGFEIGIGNGFSKRILDAQRVEPMRKQRQRVRMPAEEQRAGRLCTHQKFCLRLQEIGRIVMHGNA